MTQTSGVTSADASRTNLAVGLAALALVLYIVAMIVAQEENDWLWPVAGLVGLAAAIMGWTAGKPKPKGKALAAVVIGGLVFVTILAWTVVSLINGTF